ncbi:hypothetical protein CGH86_23455 [Vibrio parahaemolyticus]|uniref:hypothetical protein n=1 Tax=Vibrio parahaemolyticus TaxID=670 RepID=UPI001121CFF9|nr:hypothetical protein [Vibrio parahaemolyticus]TOL97391.1 hypothetical protein CGH86_23455 [Vibrio parahaemolyticus]TOM15837.1 hypothetical protein CGH84_19145 [Vibrio parahaemolyticus]
MIRLFNLPLKADEKKLLVEVVGKGNTTRLYLGLTCYQEDDHLHRYICSELLSAFKVLKVKSLSGG